MSEPKKITVQKTAAEAWTPSLRRGAFEQERKALSGLDLLKGGVWRLPPGKKSFPFHAHAATEEALFVLSGTAKVRTPEGLLEIGPGDWVAFPRGGPAHQLVNDGVEPLVYMGLSANPAGVDVVEYPDSGKVATTTGAPPAGKRFVFREKDAADYFADESDAG